MSKELLDVGDGGAAFEEMGREGMPQDVRAHFDAEASTSLPHDDADRLAAEARAASCQKRSTTVPPFREDGPRGHQELAQSLASTA